MHGRPREFKNKLKDPRAAEAYNKKVEAIRQGTNLVLACRQQKRYDPAALTAAEKLLKVVPEIYTLWNYRREALEPVLAEGGEAGKAAVDAELGLTQACLLENPKSYSTWHHRRWLVSNGGCNLDRELKLVTSALEQDKRNFHAWHYRQFIVKLMGRSTEAELAYTTDLICQDFSNYSAWHYRTILLPKLYGEEVRTVSFEELLSSPVPGRGTASSSASGSVDAAAGFKGSATQRRPLPPHILDQEYELVHQAFATDSNDQSPWMYYRWLLGNSLAHLEHCRAQGLKQQQEAEALTWEVLGREIGRFNRDHLSLDPDTKWPLLMVGRLKEAQARLGLCEEQQRGQLLEEVGSIYRRLMDLDPLRRGYYEDAAAGRAFVVVQALGSV